MRTAAEQRDMLLTVAEVAAHFQVARSTVYRWLAEGRLEVVRTPGGAPRVPASALAQIPPLTTRAP